MEPVQHGFISVKIIKKLMEEENRASPLSNGPEDMKPHDTIGITTITEESNPVMISANTSLDGYRLKNFYMTNAFQGFVWMIFHFSVVFFFTFQLKSVVLVGIFLGIANFIAFLLDIPVGILQRYYSTKKMFVLGAISQLIATGIFFSFIFNFFTTLGKV